MAYKWKPSKSARKAFAIKMQTDSNYAAEYNARKDAKAEKRRAGSRFDYASAGGEYVPTQAQFDSAMHFLSNKDNMTPDQRYACEMVMSGYSIQEKIHHDYIHIVNEMIRETL